MAPLFSVYGWLTLLIVAATAWFDLFSSREVADWAPYPIAVLTALRWKGQRGVLGTAVVTVVLTMWGGWISGFENFQVNWVSRMVGIGLISLVGAIALQVEQYERQLLAVTRKLESANLALEHQSAIDGLTEVGSRRQLESVLGKEWGRARRAQHPLALIMVDIDHFKAYNDTYGHQSGDDCLKKVAWTLKETLRRPADMVGRYGGEEFLMVLPETDEKGALAVAEGARTHIERLAISHAGSPIGQVTISLGVAATIPKDETESSALLAAADRALYQSKAEGRNRVRVQSILEPAR